MAFTLSGQTVPFVRRPGRAPPVRRLALPYTPRAWLVLTGELLGLPKALSIVSWQALADCPLSEAQERRQALWAWPDGPGTWPCLAARGVTPASLIHRLELCVFSATLAPWEAAIIEAAILAQVDGAGRWKEPMLYCWPASTILS